MTEIERICQQMKQAFEGEAWHGPSVMEVLEGIDAEAASARPLPVAHTVWEIVLHLIGTEKYMLRRMNGDDSPLAPEDDWPPVPEPNEKNWNATLQELKDCDSALIMAVSYFDESRLEEPLIKGGSSAYNNFHGNVQHNLYHAGQIILLKKALGK
jgi:uncharacterized damage-inducible protein DinB